MVKNKLYDYLIFFGICTLLVIAPLVRGAKPLWVMTIIEIEIFSLVFIWLWKINNNRSKYYLTKGDSHARATEKGLIKRKFIRTPIDLPLWLFVFLGVFSCSMSIYLYASMLAMFRLFAVVGLYYLVVNNLSKKFISYIVVLLITMGVALSLIGFAQLFCDLKHEWWYPRAFMASTFINHNHFSGYLELIIPLTIGVFVMKRRDSSHRYVNDRALFFLRCILALSLLVMVCAFVIAQSRGAWVCLTVSILIMNIILVRRRFLKKISFLIFVFIVAVGVLFILGDNDTLSQRMESLSKVEEEGTFNVRLEIWKGTVEIIKDNIWKGTGIGTFAWSFAQYRPIKVLGKRAFYSHND
ncbi:MAG: O-antigen ligase family protein, partial [Candidatus Omnitrophica bacterium]|nr:O-antigen ligase family protein [Candidatus Omnitrophota bacterium]